MDYMKFFNDEQKKYLNPSLLILGILALTILNFVAFFNFNEITTAIHGDGIDYNSSEEQLAREEGEKLAQDIVKEGIVMLKNENDALPLTNLKLNVFGFGGSDYGFAYQGGGSAKTSSFHRTSLYQSLIDGDIDINQDLAKKYNLLSFRRDEYSVVPSVYYRLYEPTSSFYSNDLWKDAIDYTNNAMVVITRTAIEKTDIPKVQYSSTGEEISSRHYLELTEDEEWLLINVESRFDNVIVLLNSSNAFNTSFLEDEKIDAALSISLPGNTGCLALSKILKGDVSPSGRLTDSIPFDFSSDPSFANSGSDGAHSYTNYGTYIDYAEDIYVGYRYYETRDKENGFSDISNNYGNGYDGIIQYPFGYGLSYTSFSYLLEEINVVQNGATTSYRDGMTLSSDASVQLKVFVSNNGKTNGQEVVQLYLQTPYTKNGIEKSAIQLAAFAKTGILEPNEGEEVNLEFKIRDFASYDDKDKNNNGIVGYELESGNYTFSFRQNVHDVLDLENYNSSSFSFAIAAPGFTYPTDEATGEKVSNLFTSFQNSISGASSQIIEKEAKLSYSIDGGDADQNIMYLSRSSMQDTFPKLTSSRTMSEEMYQNNYLTHEPRIDTTDEMPKVDQDSELNLADLVGKDYDDSSWDELVSKLSVNDLISLSSKAGFGTIAIDEIGKPRCLDLDGTAGLNTTIYSNLSSHATSYPSPTLLGQSWNWKLAYQYGLAIGKEAEALGVNGWYAPGSNLHRSAFGGRNFEYFSEDPFLTGTFVSYIVKGAAENGVYSYMKHFVADDSESLQNSQYHWMSEQSLREIYAKPFEMAVKNGAFGIMISKNRIGSTRATGSYALLTSLLRKEWGFKGAIITDYYIGGVSNNADESIRAGVDLFLNGSDNVSFDDKTSATAVIALQRAAKNTLYCYIQAQYIRNTSQGLDLGRITGAKNDVYPYWIYGLALIDLLGSAGLTCYGLWIYKHLKRKENNP